jgi:hypothetical protein
VLAELFLEAVCIFLNYLFDFSLSRRNTGLIVVMLLFAAKIRKIIELIVFWNGNFNKQPYISTYNYAVYPGC